MAITRIAAEAAMWIPGGAAMMDHQLQNGQLMERGQQG
jgi:hypothetical protein